MAEIVAGMDLGKLEAFRAALEESPVTLGLEATAVWEGHSGRSTVHIGPYDLGDQHIDRATRQYTFAYGAWREVEDAIGFVGPTDRVEPVEMALGAVGACLTNSIALNAPRNGIKLEGLEVKVHADIDPSVLFEVKGPESHTSCMPKITTKVTVKGNITDEQMDTIKRLVRYSRSRHGGVRQRNRDEDRACVVDEPASPVRDGRAMWPVGGVVMFNVLILFGIPLDLAAFDAYFDQAHRLLLQTLPDVEQLIVNRVAGATTERAPYHLVVELHFPSDKAMQESLNAEEGQAMARDFQSFASGGVTILFCRTASE